MTWPSFRSPLALCQQRACASAADVKIFAMADSAGAQREPAAAPLILPPEDGRQSSSNYNGRDQRQHDTHSKSAHAHLPLKDFRVTFRMGILIHPSAFGVNTNSRAPNSAAVPITRTEKDLEIAGNGVRTNRRRMVVGLIDALKRA